MNAEEYDYISNMAGVLLEAGTVSSSPEPGASKQASKQAILKCLIYQTTETTLSQITVSHLDAVRHELFMDHF
jgi:hypothetical protein